MCIEHQILYMYDIICKEKTAPYKCPFICTVTIIHNCYIARLSLNKLSTVIG